MCATRSLPALGRRAIVSPESATSPCSVRATCESTRRARARVADRAGLLVVFERASWAKHATGGKFTRVRERVVSYLPRIMMGRSNLELSLRSGRRGVKGAARDEPPLRFVVMGDFSQRAEPPRAFGSRRISFDNFDEVLADVTGDVTSLDQFHPDFLLESRPELEQLVRLRARLADPATRGGALALVNELLARAPSASAEGVKTERDAGGPRADVSRGSSDDEMLTRLLGRPRVPAPDSSARAASKPAPVPGRAEIAAKGAVDQLIQRALEGSDRGPAQHHDRSVDEQLLALLTQHCRSALSEPRFRALERAWRSLYFLVSRLEGDQGEVYVLDISKSALLSHLGEHAHDLEASALVQTLCQDEEGYDFIIGDLSFGLNVEDLSLMGNLSVLAALVGAPLLAHGELSLVGCNDPATIDSPSLWSLDDPRLSALLGQVRAHPAAKFLGLAAPRFLLRHPYGKRTDPIDGFPFEELATPPEPADFLWGNPAFACAWMLAQAHIRSGVHWPQREVCDVLDLPMPQYDDGTGEAVQPPLEFLMSEAARVIARERGLIALAGSKNQNKISASMLQPVG